MKTMTRAVIVVSVLLFCSINLLVFAQNKQPSFAKLDKQVKEQEGGWNGSKQMLAQLFNQERRKLGDKLEAELLKYLGNDIEKHYWISAFLEYKDYLQGNLPLPYLSLLIKHQGLSLCEGKNDRESLSDTVRLSITAAVLSERLGFKALAVLHKSRAEQIMQKDSEMKASFPAISEEENKIYKSIKESKQ